MISTSPLTTHLTVLKTLALIFSTHYKPVDLSTLANELIQTLIARRAKACRKARATSCHQGSSITYFLLFWLTWPGSYTPAASKTGKSPNRPNNRRHFLFSEATSVLYPTKPCQCSSEEPLRFVITKQKLKLGTHYHGVGVCNEVTQGIQESLVLHHLGIDVVQLGHTDCSSFPHVGVLILEALAQGLAQVLCDFIHADAAHGAHGQRTDQRVGVLTVLHRTQTNLHQQTLIPAARTRLLLLKQHLSDYALRARQLFQIRDKRALLLHRNVLHCLKVFPSYKIVTWVSLHSPSKAAFNVIQQLSWRGSSQHPKSHHRQSKLLLANLPGLKEQE